MKLTLKYPDPCPSPPREEIGRLCYMNTIEAQEDLDLTKVTFEVFCSFHKKDRSDIFATLVHMD